MIDADVPLNSLKITSKEKKIIKFAVSLFSFYVVYT